MKIGTAIGITAIAVVLAFPLGGGTWLLWACIPDIAEGWRSRSWPQSIATVEHAAAVRKFSPAPSFRSGGNATHVLELRYAFDVAGQRYSGSRRGLDDEGKVHGAEGAQKLAARYPVGRSMPVYYDPVDPKRSLLEPGVPIGPILGCVFALALFAIAAIPLVAWLHRRRKLQRWRAYR